MSSFESLREFVNERLNAAAEDIFIVFKRAVDEYEKEICRQHRLLLDVCNPEIKLQRIELPAEQHVHTEEGEERSSRLDQEESEPPQVKEGEHFELKQETDAFMLTPTIEESNHSELEPERDHQPLPDRPHLDKSHDQTGGDEGGFTGNTEPKPKSEPPQIKQEEGEHLESKQQTDAFMLTPTIEESNHSEPEPERDHQLLPDSPHVDESHEQTGGDEGGFTVKTEPKPKKRRHKTRIRSHNVKTSSVTRSKAKQSFKCETCGKECLFKSKFIIHMRVHTGEKPYCCEICGKRFCQLSGLKAHTKFHTGEMPYPCNMCVKRYRFFSELKVHMMRHHRYKSVT